MNIKIEIFDEKTFKVGGKSYARGKYIEEYQYTSFDENGICITPNLAVVFLRPIVEVNQTSPIRQQLPWKVPISWQYFLDSNSDVFSNFESFSEFLVDMITLAPPTSITPEDITLQAAIDGNPNASKTGGMANILSGADYMKEVFFEVGSDEEGTDSANFQLSNGTFSVVAKKGETEGRIKAEDGLVEFRQIIGEGSTVVSFETPTENAIIEVPALNDGEYKFAIKELILNKVTTITESIAIGGADVGYNGIAILLVDATGGNIVIASTTGVLYGKTLQIIRIDNTSNTVNFTPTGETINGASTILITGKYSGYTIENNGEGEFYTKSLKDVTLLKDFYNDVSNTSTTETDLYSYTIPANTLSAVGEKITFEVSGSLNNALATSRLRWRFLGSILLDTQALTTTVGAFKATVTIIRTGTDTGKSIAVVESGNLTNTVTTTYNSLAGLNFGTTNILKFSGQSSVGSDDITAAIGIITKYAAAP